MLSRGIHQAESTDIAYTKEHNGYSIYKDYVFIEKVSEAQLITAISDWVDNNSWTGQKNGPYVHVIKVI